MARKVRLESLIQRQRQKRTNHISSSWHTQLASLTESRGLPTLQNWCYANSIFQAFLHVPKLVNWLEQEHHSCTVEHCLACVLRRLSLNYWKDPLDWRSIDTAHKDLRRTLRQSSTFEEIGWSWRRQQDAAEFYLLLINALKRERDPKIGLMTDALFEFDIIKVMTCPNCDNKECTTESYTSLTVAFKDGAPLEDILCDITFAPSTYADRGCEVCLRYLDTPNVPQLVTGPDILVMQLVRFTDWDESESGKNKAVIPFNEELDLSPYTRGSFPLEYRLLSVVQHRGTRAHGHYITIAKGPSGEWEDLNDTSASPAIGTDPFCPRDEAAFTPYILIWARIDEKVAAESPADDETASTDDDDDDELRPLQISIDGVLQPPSGKHFVKKSALAKLNQQHMEEADAYIDTALLELETREKEKDKETEEKKKKKETKKEPKKKKKEMKKKEEKKQGEEKNGLKKLKKSSNKEIEEEEEEKQKKDVLEKRKRSDVDNKSQKKKKGFSKKQKTLDDNILSQDQTKKGLLKKQNNSDDEAYKEVGQKKPQMGKKKSGT